MELIDARKKLNEKVMKQFLDNCDDEVLVQIEQNDEQKDEQIYAKKDLRMFFVENQTLDVNDSIYFCSEKLVLLFSTDDYNWWRTEKRLKKLFGDVVTRVKRVELGKTEGAHNISIAKERLINPTTNEIELVVLANFTGSEKQCLEFLTNHYALFKIKHLFDGDYDIVVKIDDSCWMNEEQMKEKGVME